MLRARLLPAADASREIETISKNTEFMGLFAIGLLILHTCT